jgi:hypothetical protein
MHLQALDRHRNVAGSNRLMGSLPSLFIIGGGNRSARKKTTGLSQVTDKLHHIILYWINLDMNVVRTHTFSGDLFRTSSWRGIPHQYNPRYNWNIVENGIKHHKAKPTSKRSIFEIVSIQMTPFRDRVLNINKVIGNRSTFLSVGVTLCTQNVKYFCHQSVHEINLPVHLIFNWDLNLIK